MVKFGQFDLFIPYSVGREGENDRTDVLSANRKDATKRNRTHHKPGSKSRREVSKVWSIILSALLSQPEQGFISRILLDVSPTLRGLSSQRKQGEEEREEERRGHPLGPELPPSMLNHGHVVVPLATRALLKIARCCARPICIWTGNAVERRRPLNYDHFLPTYVGLDATSSFHLVNEIEWEMR